MGGWPAWNGRNRNHSKILRMFFLSAAGFFTGRFFWLVQAKKRRNLLCNKADICGIGGASGGVLHIFGCQPAEKILFFRLR